eukprot:Colp12_sorted_trinity150504_noHs@21789
MYKKIWPSAQRDVCILSHRRNLPNGDTVVCNFSIDHPDAPAKVVRCTCIVGLIAKTIIADESERPVTRKNVSCSFTYMSEVNPGGWVPPSVLRTASKRAYPEILRKISDCCVQTYKNTPPRLLL